MDEWDRTHVGRSMREGTHWTSLLLRLIHKSDVAHRERLRKCFPEEVAAWEAWMIGDGVEDDEPPPR